MKKLLVFFLVWGICFPLFEVSGQEETPPGGDADLILESSGETGEVLGDAMAESLVALYRAVRIKEEEYQRIRQEWRQAETDLEKDDAMERMEEVSRELTRLRTRFRETASGVDLSLFEETEKEMFSWEQKLGEILDPILSELERATEETRRLANLRDELRLHSQREREARRAMANIEGWMTLTEDENVLAAYREMLGRWDERARLAANQAESARLQLATLESRERGFVDGSTAFVRGFMQQRGLNLFLGIAAAVLVFLAVRLVIYVVRRLRGNRNPKNIGGRIFVLTANLVAVIGALLAMMIVFSSTGDVFLFALVVVFLLGTAWAGIKVLPQFIESLKIILNVGMVREGERLVFDEIPWYVESLGFRSKLSNELLDEGVQFLPVRELVGLHSRPWCEGELLFPTKRGDWVQLTDGRVGEIVAQNPGNVVLREWGGARVTYQTPDFLALSPRHLSGETFRLTTRFGIDYKHQAECTGKIPAVMQGKLVAGLPEIVSSDLIREVRVLFASAGSSSLDYEVQVELAGSAAAQYEELQFALQRLLVEACNENGWGIPFPQLTVHRAND